MLSAPTQTTKHVDRENLTPAQRFGELVAIFVTLLFFSYFAHSQAINTGFFTAAFGPWEMVFFYGPLLLSMAAPLTRAVVGRRNPARPLEVITNLFLAAAALWLLQVFPFDFTHIADALPSGLQFLFAWVNDTVGRIVLTLQLIVCPIVALATAWQYAVLRQREQNRARSI